MTNRAYLTQRLPAVLCAGLLPFVFLPLTVYALNLNTVDVPKTAIVCWGTTVGLAAVLVLGLLARLPRAGRFVTAVCEITALTCFVLTLFPNRTGELTGMGSFLQGIGSLVPSIKILALAVGVAIWRRRRPDQVRSSVRAVLGVALAASLLIAATATSRHSRSVQPADADQARVAELGSGTNVLVIVFDGFPGERMVELLEAHPELKQDLAGFTLYPWALAAALNTQAGISTMLTGEQEVAIHEQDWGERNRRSLTESFLADARQAGFDADYLSFLLPPAPCGIPFHNEQRFFAEYPSPAAMPLAEFFGFWSVASARVLPAAAARWIQQAAGRLSARSLAGTRSDVETLRRLPTAAHKAVMASKLAFQHLVDTLTLGDGSGKVLFFHSKLTHRPHILAADGQYQADADASQTYLYTVRALVQLLERLRAIGAFERTLVIVVADHGTVDSHAGSGGLAATASELAPAFNPLVLVKPPYAAAPFRQSEMTVWLGDVAATVRDLLGTGGEVAARSGARSLLRADDPARRVRLALYFRPDQSGHHSRLLEWPRLEVEGVYADFMAALHSGAGALLERPAQVKLTVGRDDLRTMGVQNGWMIGTGVQYRAAAEVDGRLLAKRYSPGAWAVFRSQQQYEVCEFDEAAEWTAFLTALPASTPVLAAALQVPPSALTGMVPDPETLPAAAPWVNVIYTRAPASGSLPDVRIATNDLVQTLVWRP
jgi:hypothetical protein